jgi:glycosyltransferase involved in cell wall biosynthesis
MNARRLFVAGGIFYPEPGGPSTYLHELLPELQRLGWDVRALAYGDSGNAVFPYPVMRVPRRVLPLRLADYARAARLLLGWADLVYIHSLGLPLYGGHAPRVIKIVGDQAWERAVRKGWIPPNEDVDAFQTRRYGFQAEANKSSRAREVRRMDGVIVPSEYLKRMVVGWGVEPSKVQVIYNALPPQAEALTLTQTDARARMGFDGAPTVLTAARLLPWKGVDHLIAALKQVANVRLLVAGDGPELDSLRAQADAAGLNQRVRFLGRLDRAALDVAMRAADYTVLYSGYEGLSHTLLESLRAGTPVIASDKGGNPEVVRHGVNGLLVPYVDVGALAEALREAFRPDVRDQFAANAAVGMERFDFGGMVEQTSAALAKFV